MLGKRQNIISASSMIFLAIFLVSEVAGNIVFVEQAQAQTSTGSIAGKAIAAGTACFLSTKVEDLAVGLITKLPLFGEDASEMPSHPYAVPSVSVNLPSEIGKVQTSNALMKSKDCIRDVLAKILLDWITNETVNWISGGGKPGFVTNWKNFSNDAFNAGIGELIFDDANFRSLCSPFSYQVRLSLLPVQHFFGDQIRCTLDQVTNNIQNFYDDFRNGGWVTYVQMARPENDYFGVMMMIQDEALRRAWAEQRAKENEALAGKGFLSVKQCEEWDPNDKTKCIKESIVTPGDAVGQTVGAAITSDVQWSANIKSWVAALVNAALNRLLKEGLAQIKGGSSSSGFYFTNSSPRNYYYGSGGNYNPMVGYQYQAKTDLTDGMQKVFDDLTVIKGDKQSTLSYASSTLQTLTALQAGNCQPPVSAADISDAQKKVQTLTNDLASIENLRIKINQFIQYIESLTDSQFTQQFSSLQSQFNDLSSQASTFGDTYQSEAALSQAEADNAAAKTRAQTCGI